MIAKIADFRTIDGRPPFFALLRDVRFQNGDRATDHLWTLWNGAFFKAKVGVGDPISISARVIEYNRRDGTADYGIDDVQKVRLVLTVDTATNLALALNAAQTLSARVTRGEVAVRNSDEPRLQAAMLSRFDGDPTKYGNEIKVEFGPAVALFMLNNSAHALGVSLEQYANRLTRDGSGKELLGQHIQNLERLSRVQPLIVKLQSVSNHEAQCQRIAEAHLKAGENPLTPDDDDETVYHKMYWLRSSKDNMILLLDSKIAVSIFPAGVVGAMAAWNDGKHPDAFGQIAHILRLTDSLNADLRLKLARGLTRAFASWIRAQRRNKRRKELLLRIQVGPTRTV
ncbi:hypothetical protein [Acidisoma sp. S159]|uniref:hypothetical protein n=1 Tax=Acidisoma sp. S159 TaxID=1747225 RepID=UPI00131DA887|nr:hypothetical protein [Acidisoma sp. S159]